MNTSHANVRAPLTDWKAKHGDFFSGKRCLVTGGAGFIGSHLAAALCDLDASVAILDDLSGGCVDNLPPGCQAAGEDQGPRSGSADCRFINGRIQDESVVRRAMEDCQYVFHLAA